MDWDPGYRGARQGAGQFRARPGAQVRGVHPVSVDAAPVLRFRRFVAWAGAGAPGGDLAFAAARLGYADQAHLTRECARLAGVTPAALLAARRPSR
jgi:hypothetical protein